MKPMSHQQRCYVQKHHCFLLRNYEKVKKAKDHARLTAEKEAELERAANKQGNIYFFFFYIFYFIGYKKIFKHY